MELWSAIKKLEGATLKTLDRGFPFDILDVSDQVITIKPRRTNKERDVHRKELEGAYKYLLAFGQISRTQIEENYSPRNPVYVAAILAQLEGVITSRSPIVLRLHHRNQ